MCRIRFAALMLAALAAPDDLVRAQDLPSAPSSASARLPVRLVERPSRAAATLAAPAADSALPLKPLQKPSGDANGRFRPPSAGNAVTTVITSLAVVLGLFVLCVLILRKANARNGATLPGEVVQTLGRVPLSGRQEMHLVRVGNKLLLLSVTATARKR